MLFRWVRRGHLKTCYPERTGIDDRWPLQPVDVNSSGRCILPRITFNQSLHNFWFAMTCTPPR